MRLCTIALATVLALAASTTAGAAHKRTCGPREASTAAKSASMRVYYDNDDYYYACLYRGGKSVLLGQGFLGEGSGPPVDLGHWRFAGRYLGFITDYEAGPASGPSFTFTVVDVRRRKVVHKFEVPHGSYGRTVVTFSGRAALVFFPTMEMPSGTPDRRLVTLDAQGSNERDRGAHVHDLTLQGRTIHWLHGNESRSHVLQ
jgi:hypothetical protein